MGVGSKLEGLRRSRVFRVVFGASVVGVGAASGTALGADRGSAPSPVVLGERPRGNQPAKVGLDLERRKVRVAADRSILRGGLDAAAAGVDTVTVSPDSVTQSPASPQTSGAVDTTDASDSALTAVAQETASVGDTAIDSVDNSGPGSDTSGPSGNEGSDHEGSGNEGSDHEDGGGDEGGDG